MQFTSHHISLSTRPPCTIEVYPVITTAIANGQRFQGQVHVFLQCWGSNLGCGVWWSEPILVEVFGDLVSGLCLDFSLLSSSQCYCCQSESCFLRQLAVSLSSINHAFHCHCSCLAVCYMKHVLSALYPHTWNVLSATWQVPPVA